MARFVVHLANGDRVPVDAKDPAAARASVAKARPGAVVSKVKLDRIVHRPPPHAARRHRGDSRRHWF